MARASGRTQSRFGIGEWYGRSFTNLSSVQRKEFAELQKLPKRDRTRQACPFQSSASVSVPCNKEGGVCSLRLYVRDGSTNEVSVAPAPRNALRCTCPNRFKQGGLIYQWIAGTVLGHNSPVILKEIPFLESTVPPEIETEGSEPEPVGLIDNILVVPDSSPLLWCALEIQAVYFSGAAMSSDFIAIREHPTHTMPFPAGNRRPDYRSSAPKRLMPQLQIKVPSLRRWGKKMAVVVDQDFFKNMGPMQQVKHISNCDVAWFVVQFDESQGDAVLTSGSIYLTTLEHSVEGLTGGMPVSLDVFENRVRLAMGD